MTKQKIVGGGMKAVTDAMKNQQQDEYTHQWQRLRNRLDSILLTASLKTDEVRKLTLQLDHMDSQKRREFIKTHWGPACLNVCEPLILQLEVLEKHRP